MVSRDVIVDKLDFIKSFDIKFLDTLTSEEDIEKEITETGDFERYVQENILVIENWLKSQEEEVRSSTLHYPLEPPNLSSININSHTRLPKTANCIILWRPFIVPIILKHDRIKDTILQVRSKYWIIRIRQLIRSIIKRGFYVRDFNRNHTDTHPVEVYHHIAQNNLFHLKPAL